MKKLKVCTVIGTRPEIIRLSATIKKLDQFLDHTLIHTGQNYDYELNEVFFEDLNLRKPDIFLNCDTTSIGRVYGDILIKSEEAFNDVKPEALLILGDTNSSIAAIIAKRMKIPIFHMEAGNRSFDMNVPEEINRKILDHIADFNLVYTEHARRHLISEGLPHRRIYLTGSPMMEVLNEQKDKISLSNILEELNLNPRNYFVVSMHREENVDNPKHLKQILETLKLLEKEWQLPIVVSTHPRTHKKMDEIGYVSSSSKIRFMKPFRFSDYICLQKYARCTISDSGTISEESAILGFPAVSLRNSMERPECQDAGKIILAGLQGENLLTSVYIMITSSCENTVCYPKEYFIDDFSNRVLCLVSGNTKLSNKWWGITSK